MCFLNSAISVAEAMHISFPDLPASSARWPATHVHTIPGNNNSEKVKNVSHSLQTNGYSAVPGKLPQSRQLSGLKMKGVKSAFWGPTGIHDRKCVGKITLQTGAGIEKSQLQIQPLLSALEEQNSAHGQHRHTHCQGCQPQPPPPICSQHGPSSLTARLSPKQ